VKEKVTALISFSLARSSSSSISDQLQQRGK
jgi:hypothetical protein